MNRNRLAKRVGIGLAVALPLMLFAGVAFGQAEIAGSLMPDTSTPTANFAGCMPSAGGVLDNLANQFGGFTSNWMTSAQNYAKSIFAALAGLELAWSGIQYLMKRRDLEDFLASAFLKFLSLMFFYLVMIQFAPQWVPKIVASFVQIGQGIGGNPSIPTIAGSSTLGTMLSPSAILGQGICLAGQVMLMPGPSGFFEAIAGGLMAVLACLMLVLAYVVMALTLLLAIIEAYIVTGAGLVMLGFLGSCWTSTWGEKYFGYAVSTGVKLMVVYLVVGLGQNIVTSYVISTGTAAMAAAQSSSNGVSASGYAGLCAVALIFAGLAWNIPKLASTFLNGQPGMGIGDLAVPAAIAGAATAAAAGAIGAGASGAAKGLMALKNLTSGSAGGGGTGSGASAANGMAALAALTSGSGGASGASPGATRSGPSSSASPSSSPSGTSASGNRLCRESPLQATAQWYGRRLGRRANEIDQRHANNQAEDRIRPARRAPQATAWLQPVAQRPRPNRAIPSFSLS